MSRKNISRNKVSRRLKHPIAHKEITRNVKPGYRSNSGMPRNQMTIYGMKLSEKQKVRYKYDLKDQHVKKYVQEAVKNKKMDTLDSLCKSLECNVAVAVWRLIGGSIRLSKQLVNHGHVLLNNKKVNLCRHAIKVGDVIKLKDKAANIKHVQDLIMANSNTQFDYFKADKSKFTIELLRIPTPKEIPTLESINMRSVVEFY